jgi:hypothetical protein
VVTEERIFTLLRKYNYLYLISEKFASNVEISIVVVCFENSAKMKINIYSSSTTICVSHYRNFCGRQVAYLANKPLDGKL